MGVIGIDIDDTIADGVGFFVPQLNRHFNKNIKIEEINGRFCDVYGIDQKLINEFFYSFGDDIFSQLSPLPNSVETIKGFYDEGHEIIIVTARPETSRKITENWLNKFNIPYHSLYFDKEKSKLCKSLGVEIFIDDYPIVIENMFSRGITSLFMDIPKNINNPVSNGIHRVKNWNEIDSLVRSLLKKGVE